MRTWVAVSLRRVPLQIGQGRGSSSSSPSWRRSSSSSASRALSKSSSLEPRPRQTSPKPRQCWHQPCGELKEKSRGSRGSKARWHEGQFISVLSVVDLPLASSRRAVPLPRRRALRTRSSAFFRSGESSSPTMASMVCSLKRSSFWKASTATRSPSTMRVSMPWRAAARATSVWKPLRPLTRFARILTGPLAARALTSSAMAVGVRLATGTSQSGQNWVPSLEKRSRRKW